MNKQLNLSQRPWVSLDLPSLRIDNGTLTFDPKAGFGSITITGEMLNKGNSVAMHTLSNIEIVDMSEFPPDVQLRTVQVCKAPRNPSQTVGYNLFPGDRAPINQEAEFYLNDIASGLAHAMIKGRVTPLAIICIQYQSVFERRYHLTQYVFNLWTSQNIGAFEPKGVVSDLNLAHAFFGDLAY